MNSRAQRLLLCVMLSSLWSTSTNAQLSDALRNVLGGADETAALSHSEFTKPIVLHIDSDGFAKAQRLKALNGVSNHNWASDLNQAGGPNDFNPCIDQVMYPGRNPGIDANVGGYNFDNVTIARWLSNNRIFALETYKLRYPRTPQGYQQESVYVCPILNDNVAKLLPHARNVHDGIEIPIGRRVLTKWTFRNRYDTPVPGKGNVKVFAGTFTYKIDPIVPIVSFSGEGTATVKVYLDPDNGRWTVENLKKQDPGIKLTYKGKVLNTIDTAQYSYIEVAQDDKTVWLATARVAVKNGDTIRFDGGKIMANFHSKTLNRTFPSMTFPDRVIVSNE